MEEVISSPSETDWQELMSVFRLIAERGRRVRLTQKATTVDIEPLAGDRSTAVDQLPAKNADTL